MPRSNWKGPFVHKAFTKKKANNFDSWSRSTMVMPSFVGKQFNVYNGRVFVSVKVTSLMIGHKLGEFVPTRKTYNYKK